MDDRTIARWRLRRQHLVAPHAPDAAAVIRHLLAIQAENPHQSAWAVGCRTARADPDDLAGLLADGSVIRTHVLRSTWHYVAAEDLGWLLDLTSPRIVANVLAHLDTQHGIGRPELTRLTGVVLGLLSERTNQARSELAAGLAAAGHELSGSAVMTLLAALELDQRVCSGSPDAGEHTYALFTDRVAAPRRPDRDEALAELAWRYVAGHGPATERDLAYWATLTVTDVRRGLAAAGDRLARFSHDDRTFWYVPEDPPTSAGDPGAHLLQILDETYRGFQESRWVLDGAGLVPRGREVAIGMALVDGQLVASMRRVVVGAAAEFRLAPYRPLTGSERADLADAAERYGRYLDLPVRLIGAGGDG